MNQQQHTIEEPSVLSIDASSTHIVQILYFTLTAKDSRQYNPLTLSQMLHGKSFSTKCENKGLEGQQENILLSCSTL